MPVRRTPFLAGHFYHIYNRGVDAGRVFFSLDNYEYFLSLIANKLRRHGIRIVAYCLMPNHFHLLLGPDLDETVPAFMNGLCGAYTQALNRQRGRQGPLFQGRYRSVEVEAEAYLIHLARYIHLNPVVSRLVVSPIEWPYSNYADIIGRRQGGLGDSSLVPDRFARGDDYREFVEEGVHDQAAPQGFGGFLLD
jgi:REP element-mobilizing transposase RayT